MNLWKRLKNLWRISSYEVIPDGQPYQFTKNITGKKKLAEIISRKNVIEEIVNGN